MHFFPNSNKIAIKLRIKFLFDFNIKSLIFLYFEEVILSSLLKKEIFQKKLKSNDPLFEIRERLEYENNEIPNSLRGSLSCVEFLGSTKMQ